MNGISGDLYGYVQAALLRCGPFDSDRALRPLFVDARLSAWRDLLPGASNRAERVRAVVDTLSEHANPAGENALVLLLRVVRDHMSPGDACHGQLGALADALARELKASTITSQAPSPVSKVNTISTSGPFRERKRQLVKQRLDALMDDYEAANTQLLQTLAEVDRVRIKRQMETLEKQIQETEDELGTIK